MVELTVRGAERIVSKMPKKQECPTEIDNYIIKQSNRPHKWIQEHINKVEELEKNYLAHKYIPMDENSLESIRTFQEWHSAASVLFCEFISEDDKFLKTFVEADISGNAYVLASTLCAFNASKLNDAGISDDTTPIK